MKKKSLHTNPHTHIITEKTKTIYPLYTSYIGGINRHQRQMEATIRPVWSESSLCAHWVAQDPRFLHADSEDSD